VPHMSHHSLRHGYATYLFDQGKTIEEVANCLGNSIEVCHQIYVKWKSRKAKEVARTVTFGTNLVQTADASDQPKS